MVQSPREGLYQKGCLPVAIDELKNVMGKKRKAFIVTDTFLYRNGYTKAITDKLTNMGIATQRIFDVAPDPTLACAKEGRKAMAAFRARLYYCAWGGSAMDAAKIMWVMYEHPEVNFMDMAMRFQDIRKRIYTFPEDGRKAYFHCDSTSAGNGRRLLLSLSSPTKQRVKYPLLADYELMPEMAIVGTDLMMNCPKGLGFQRKR